MKKQLLNDMSAEDKEDGYSIIKEVFLEDEIGDICSKKMGKSACRDLIIKYGAEWAIWNFVEILSLSETIRLYEYFYNKYNYRKYNNICGLLYSVRYMRNATAHNNCLLNSIKQG